MNAIIATEDADFYKHGGISPKAILRAGLKDLLAGKKVEGASTLTQQLAKLIALADPKPEAKYVAFTTFHDPKSAPGQRRSNLDWPYVEGLRLDEAMHPLSLLVTGVYGRDLPNQNGAPLRLHVPWKYGFKSIKSIVRIRLVDKQPRNTWNVSAPDEYGFYSNVNPDRKSVV